MILPALDNRSGDCVAAPEWAASDDGFSAQTDWPNGWPAEEPPMPICWKAVGVRRRQDP